MTYEELENKISDWADQRGLLSPYNAPKQFMKVTEELGELASAILKGDRDAELDAFGDVLVTLIILSEQRDIDLVSALGLAYKVIENRTGKTVNGTFIKD